MTVAQIGICLLIIHILWCLLTAILIKTGVIKLESYLLPFELYIPFWGPLCVIGIWRESRKDRDSKEIGLEKLQIQNEIYKTISSSHESADEKVVPIEEALLINDTALRRELIMDLLNEDPARNIEILRQARMNTDTEVVHYAVTAMTEISKDYDTRLQKMEEEYAENPQDKAVLDGYCELLGSYIEKGLAEGQMEKIQRFQYARLLEEKLKLESDRETYGQLVDNYLLLKEYGEAGGALERMKREYGTHEEYWLLRVRYFAERHQGAGLERTLREMEEAQVYLSAENKRLVAFWRQNTGHKGTEGEGGFG